MKKKTLLLLTVASAMLFTGCNKKSTPVSSSVNSSEASSLVSENGATSDTVTSNATSEAAKDWTDADKKLIADTIGVSGIVLPYLENTEYYLEVDEDYDNSIYVLCTTPEATYEKYIETLKAMYPDNFTDTDVEGYEGDICYYFDITDKKVEIATVGYTYEGEFVVDINIYQYDEGEDDGDDDDNDDNLIPTSTVINPEDLSLKANYPTSSQTTTANGVKYEYSINVCRGANEPYDEDNIDAFQFRKSTHSSVTSESKKGYIRNTSALPASDKVTLEIYTSYTDFGKLTVYGANSAISADSTSEEKATYTLSDGVDSGYTSGSNTVYKYVLTYTFTTKYTFFKVVNDTKYAVYAKNIDFKGAGGTSTGGGSSESGNEDVTPSEPTKTVDFTKATIKTKDDLGTYVDGISSTGNQKVLVVPVDFSDYDAATLGYSVDTLEKAFNSGTKDELDYVSVKDYFAESSYGNLNIDFDVYDSWVRGKKSFSDYQSATQSTDIYGYTGSNSYATNEQVILNDVLSYLDSQGMDLSQYDTDNNGTIDAVVLIYSAPIDLSEEETSYEKLGWAWRYWNMLGDTSSKDTVNGGYNYYEYDGVYANDYLWASYEFLFEGYDDEGYTVFTYKDHVNTYTYIHEFSHVLGADDYYDTDDAQEKADNMAGYDVMDQYCGDHDAFTKFNYGWITSSTLVQADTTLTIRDFETSGDTIILANSWDDTKGCFQEYWVIQYYTNTGLNYDADNEYVGYFASEGLIMYHVNASLTEEDGYYYLTNNNTTYTGSNGQGSKNSLIEYVKTSSGKYVLTEGDTSSSTAKDDNGKKIPFTYEITSQGDGSITVKFTKNA